MPFVLNDQRSNIAVNDDLSLENSVMAPTKSQGDVSQCFDENAVAADCDTKSCGVSESGNGDPTDRKCPSSDDSLSSSGVDGNCLVSQSDNFLNGQPHNYDSNTETASDNTSQAMDVSVEVDDCWWNKVDSHTWLQGLQSYLLLHSTANTELRQLPGSVLPANVTPYAVIANPASRHPSILPSAAESAVAARNVLFAEHQYAQPALAPITGYHLSKNGVLHGVPIYYFPVVNYSVCKPSPAVSADVSQQIQYVGAQQSTMASVDLVSFMHNYCLPPSSIPQSLINSSTHNTAGQHIVGSQTTSYEKRSCVLMNTRGATAASDVLPEQAEDSHSSGWPMTSESSSSVVMGFLSNSSVCLTPRSLSSRSPAESWNEDALEPTSSFSTVAVSTEESNVKACDLLLAESDLTIPGWFGKGLGIKRSKRRLSRQS